MPKTKEEIKKIKEELEECKNGWIRTQADFDNYRKRTEVQRVELMSYANREILEKILPVLDHFELAAKHIPQDLENNDWAKGILHIKKNFEEILSSAGLKKMPESGQFDPNLHEAISHEPSDLEPNEIIETVQSGYMLGDKVLRVAKVRVANGSK